MMGIREIRDGLESLLPERIANLRRVQRREGEAGGSSREFQQLFEFASKDNDDNQEEQAKSSKEQKSYSTAPPRALIRSENDQARKRDEMEPGQLIDIEA